MLTPNMSDIYPKSIYRPEIDGLRALAVVAVIINHFKNSILPSGYLGVDIFFVISGFVITSSLMDRQRNSFGEFLLDFYVRRIKRLVPALVLFVVITSVLLCLFDQNPQVSLRTGIASLFGLSNFYLQHLSFDYFAASTELNAFVHTWSLGVEEQFYLLFPFLLWFSGFGRLNTNGSCTLFRVLGTLTVASFIGFFFLYQSNQPAAYFLMPTRLWELSAGCVLSLGLKHSNTLIRRLENIPPFLATAGVVGVLFAPLEFAVPATVGIVLLTMTLIASLRSGTAAYNIFTHPQVVYIGRISYSLYLWHWGVLALSRWTIGIQWWSVPFLTALMFLMAILSYRFVETPLRKSNWSTNRILSVGYGMFASVAACGLLLVLSAPLSGRLYLGNFLNISTPHNLQRTWWVDKITGEYLEKCHVYKGFSSSLLSECLEIAPGKSGTVYLIGDSHARNYLPALKEVFRAHSTAYITMGYGCAFLPLEMSSQYSNVGCSDYVGETAEYLLRNVHNGDVVFVGQLINQRRQSPLYMDFIKSFAIRLSEKGVPVVLLDDVFPPKLPPEECVDLPWTAVKYKKGCFETSEVVTKAYSDFEQLALDSTSQVESLFYAPLRTGLCHEGVCGQTSGTGLPIWHDRGHITEAAAAELASLLRTRLTQQGFYQSFSASR